MRNSSDIFCLKELKDGDNSGTQMFSVNGMCSLSKRGRNRNLHAGSSSFEYGSSKSYGDLAQVHEDTNAFVEKDDLETLREADEELDQLEQLHLENGDDSFRSDELNYEAVPSPTEENIEQVSLLPNVAPKKKKSALFRKIAARKEEEKVTESAMARNPLTGAGIELETHRKPKKGNARTPKFSW
ncbi:uncharacterized protein LOC126743095 [Anthonomus grandis grandis]|uniref:uncharacterized protein LOC126743095 n=1 Tax=Anthonomus grandis grandis TaxID=2921223 RepID=UPI002164F33B|nr:uncharacterized protein LOC126743095 [Anthonomus grandis grandis]